MEVKLNIKVAYKIMYLPHSEFQELQTWFEAYKALKHPEIPEHCFPKCPFLKKELCDFKHSQVECAFNIFQCRKCKRNFKRQKDLYSDLEICETCWTSEDGVSLEQNIKIGESEVFDCITKVETLQDVIYDGALTGKALEHLENARKELTLCMRELFQILLIYNEKSMKILKEDS